MLFRLGSRIADAFGRWSPVARDRAAGFVLAVVAVVMSLVFLRVNPGRYMVYDDSYITLTFARNLLRGAGFTFDGVHTGFGATSPPHILLIALFGLPFGRAEDAAIVLGIVTLALSGILIYCWLREVLRRRDAALLGALLFLTHGWMVFDALSGLETLLFIMFLALTLYLFERGCGPLARGPEPDSTPEPGHGYAWGIALGLTVAVRPDGWFFVAGFVAYALARLLIRRRPGPNAVFSPVPETEVCARRNLRLGLIVLGVTLVIPVLVSFALTHSLLPTTTMTKAYLFGELGDPLKEKWRLFSGGVRTMYSGVIMPVIILLPVALLLARGFWRRFYFILAALVFYAAYFRMLPGATWHYYGRYQHIFIPALVLLLAESTVRLNRLIPWYQVRRGLLFLLFAAFALNQYFTITVALRRYREETTNIRNVGEKMSHFLRDDSEAGVVIATHDIGALGYFSKRPILDLVGLVQPEVTNCYRNPETGRLVPLRERNLMPLIDSEQPGYLVILPVWKRFLNLHPDSLTDRFTFRGKFGNYLLYEVNER